MHLPSPTLSNTQHTMVTQVESGQIFAELKILKKQKIIKTMLKTGRF